MLPFFEHFSEAKALSIIRAFEGLFTWREGSPANRANRLTELLGEG